MDIRGCSGRRIQPKCKIHLRFVHALHTLLEESFIHCFELGERIKTRFRKWNFLLLGSVWHSNSFRLGWGISDFLISGAQPVTLLFFNNTLRLMCLVALTDEGTEAQRGQGMHLGSHSRVVASAGLLAPELLP